MKTCACCHLAFPETSDFFQPLKKKRPDGTVWQGWAAECRPCRNKRYKPYYEKNRERLIAGAVESTRKRRERPEVREAERISAREAMRRAWADPEQREKLQDQGKAWREANPEYYQERGAMLKERRSVAREARKRPPGQCSECGQVKEATEEFYYKRKDGSLVSACKECVKAKRNAFFGDNRERLLVENRERMKDPEKRAAKVAGDRAYYEANKDQLSEQMAEYRARPEVKARRREFDRQRWQNPEQKAELQSYLRHYHVERMSDPAQREKAREASREYARKHPEKMKAHTRNRRARIRKAEGVHTVDDVLAILARQSARCFWCGCDVSGGKHTVDHYVPLARGGSNGPENIVIACGPCNYRKRDMMPETFLAYLEEITAAT